MAKNLQKERREMFLEKLITEALANVLVEQEDMRQQPPQQQQQQVSAAPPAAPGPAAETNTMDPDNQQVQQETDYFDVDEMVDRLNVLRGSRSFTDPEVYGRLTTFFNGLTDEQKNSIEWLLTELGKLVIDASEEEIEPDQQQQPVANPPTPQQNTRQSNAATSPQQGGQQPTSAPVTPTGI